MDDQAPSAATTNSERVDASEPSTGDAATVLHLPPPMRRRSFNLAMARAKQLQEAGEQVLLTHCGLKGGTCFSNVTGSAAVCAACRFSTRKSVAAAGLPLVTLVPPTKQPASGPPLRERKAIATGARSGLISLFRVLAKDLNRVPRLRTIKHRYYAASVGLLESWNQLLGEINVGRVEAFNGRIACNKFLLVGAKREGIPFNTLDYNGGGHPMLFVGHTPHDRHAIQARILSNPADMKLAESWFNGRRDGSRNKFAAQHKSFEPPELDSTCTKRVSIFLSSQDECESLGPAWRSRFRDTAKVVQEACRAYPTHHFCVRFHPNQAGILSDVVGDYQGMESLPNLTIYPPTDSIDTYRLVEWSDVVVAFQSTVALEACWLRKPVIQLGPSFYDGLGIAENPGDLAEFLELLAPELAPRALDPAAKFAHYALKDHDELPHLGSGRRGARATGQRRSAAYLAKPAKEFNTLVIKLLKRHARRQLATGRAA